MNCILYETKKHLKLGVLAEAVAVLLTASSWTSSACVPDTVSEDPVRIYINGVEYPGRTTMYHDTTYIELGEFSNEVYVCTSEWNEEAVCASYAGEGIDISVTDGTEYLSANGRYFWCEHGVFADEESTYVPLRAAAKAFGAEVEWNAEEFAAYVVTGTGAPLPGEEYYDADEVYWLSRIIYSEAGIEPFRGQIAVGNVVLNRLEDDAFPDTIYDVVFDWRFGVQFSPTANGTIYQTPSDESVIAAKICLEGYTVSDDILYFINASLAKNFWVPQNRDYVMTISGHDFYS